MVLQDSGGGSAENKLMSQVSGYKGPEDFPSKASGSTLYVDDAAQVLLVPINGVPCPFHVSTIKNVSMQQQGTAGNVLRLNFVSPGPCFLLLCCVFVCLCCLCTSANVLPCAFACVGRAVWKCRVLTWCVECDDIVCGVSRCVYGVLTSCVECAHRQWDDAGEHEQGAHVPARALVPRAGGPESHDGPQAGAARAARARLRVTERQRVMHPRRRTYTDRHRQKYIHTQIQPHRHTETQPHTRDKDTHKQKHTCAAPAHHACSPRFALSWALTAGCDVGRGQILDMKKAFSAAEREKKARDEIVAQEPLTINPNRGPRLQNLRIYPNLLDRGKRTDGDLEAHVNGFRFTVKKAPTQVGPGSYLL